MRDNLMHNISLKNKILLILALPIFTIIFLSVDISLSKLEEKNAMINTKNYLELSILSNKLLSSIQEEREISLIFTTSYGKTKENELRTVRNESNERISALDEYIKNFDTSKYSNDINTKIDNLKKQLSLINDTRNKIDSISISDEDLLIYYTSIVDTILSFMYEIFIYSNDVIL